VSSSKIRAFDQKGEVEEASKLLEEIIPSLERFCSRG